MFASRYKLYLPTEEEPARELRHEIEIRGGEEFALITSTAWTARTVFFNGSSGWEGSLLKFRVL